MPPRGRRRSSQGRTLAARHCRACGRDLRFRCRPPANMPRRASSSKPLRAPLHPQMPWAWTIPRWRRDSTSRFAHAPRAGRAERSAGAGGTCSRERCRRRMRPRRARRRIGCAAQASRRAHGLSARGHARIVTGMGALWHRQMLMELGRPMAALQGLSHALASLGTHAAER